MSKNKDQKIYYINRYDSNKRNQVRENSGYEQIVKYSKVFLKSTSSRFISELILRLVGKNKPADYIKLTAGEEFILFFKALITGRPVFYLYADKDAYILPILKRKFKTRRVKLYGALHWPKEISSSFSFYKNDLATAFDGLITLSSSLSNFPIKNVSVIPHGINNEYWSNDNVQDYDNYYVLVGISNRDHDRQIDIMNRILAIDPQARFKVAISDKIVREKYKKIENTEVFETRIDDEHLKYLYLRAKAVILFQNYCLASNVILESMAMGVPVIANNVGDISEYLGSEYALYIDGEEDYSKLKEIAFSESYRSKVANYLHLRRHKFDWSNISEQTKTFINS